MQSLLYILFLPHGLDIEVGWHILTWTDDLRKRKMTVEIRGITFTII